MSSRLRTRVETGRLGTSVAGGGKAWEAARGLGWDGNKGTGAGSWVGEGTGTRLGFLHFSKAWEICGPSGNRCRPNLPAEPSSLHCRPLFLAFPRLATESPWPILGSAFARKRAVALLGSPFLRSLSNLSLRKPSGRYSGPSVQLLQTLPRSRPSPTLFSAGGVGGLGRLTCSP